MDGWYTLSPLKWFSTAYDHVIKWSKHKHAAYYLAAVSFIEACIFPIPPDIMLISMGLATPKSAWNYALITTIFSVLGGMLGYCIGMYAMQIIAPYIMTSSFSHHYMQAVHWFENSGLLLVILAGVTPFPYKIFAMAAGAMHTKFSIFVLGSILGRGLRFFMLSGLLYFFGQKLETKLRKYIDFVGIGILTIIVGGFCIYRLVA